FLHECLDSLHGVYRSVAGAGMTFAHGDPVTVLRRFRDRGWDVVAMRGVTGRYGRERDARAAAEADVTFVGGDGIVRNAERTRADWSDAFERYVTADPHDWDPDAVGVERAATGLTPDRVADAYGVTPTKAKVPTGGLPAARRRLEGFVEEIGSYPGNVSSPKDAREGCSGLSPYIRFGCLSVRQAFRYVDANAPDGNGKRMFLSRLAWNRHYNQKLADWPGWVDEAVNPALRGFNADRHDPDLVAAWKEGRTGYPMVDASMRCLRGTGWLNFRMRAMCASFFHHVLQQPWQVGADWYHYHLIDSDAGINYTQWQSQAGLVGKPTVRLYNPRKQVRDQDPDGEWITEWVPELAPLPATHLDAPEKTPLHVQDECGVRIGEDYPYPVVEYEARRERFHDRYGTVKAAAADRLADPEVARRASLSGGRDAAEAIAERHGRGSGDAGGDRDVSDAPSETQHTLSAFDDEE
ncbi:MAG: FAD-binding domain-containing protein, partial [Haloferacaceae archaeon]